MELFIHLGYQKCASTTLQRNLFCNHSELIYFGRLSKENKNFYYTDLLHKVRSLKSLEYKSLVIDPYKINLPEGKKVLISDEGLSNSRWSDIGIIADRLKQIFSDFKIIFIIRKQVDLIRSFYDMNRADLFYYGSNKKISFKTWLERNFKYYNLSFMISLHYDRLINKYIDLIGKDRIKILFFEEFVENKNLFIKELSSFIGIDAKESIDLLTGKHENKGKTNLEHFLNSYKGKWLPKLLPMKFRESIRSYIKKTKITKTIVPEDQKNIILANYKETNRNLLDISFVDSNKLKKYCYI